MKISTRFNKGNIALLAGAVVTVVAGFFPDLMNAGVQGSLQTVLVWLGVMLIGNEL